MRILVLYKALYGTKRLKKSVLDHLTMFDGADGKHEIIYWNIADGAPFCLKRLDCQIIVLHTTFLSIRYGDQILYKYWRRRFSWLSSHGSLKVFFPQDERYFNLELQDSLNSMDGHVHLYSIFGHDSERVHQLYPSLKPNIKVHACLTGYINEGDSRQKVIDWTARKVDVFYRAKNLPPWVGRYGQLKQLIADKLIELSSKLELKIDASTKHEDMLLGSDWIKALNDSKYMVACEAGGSAIDERGKVTDFVLNYRSKNQGSNPSFSEIDKAFTPSWDNHRFRALGPKNLEAISTKTCQILVEGSYSNILIAHQHYIPIKEDLSDLETVLKNLNDVKGKAIAETAYREVLQSDRDLSYTNFANQVLNKAAKDINIAVIESGDTKTKSLLFTVKAINSLFDRIPLLRLPNLIKLWAIKTFHCYFL